MPTKRLPFSQYIGEEEAAALFGDESTPHVGPGAEQVDNIHEVITLPEGELIGLDIHVSRLKKATEPKVPDPELPEEPVVIPIPDSDLNPVP